MVPDTDLEVGQLRLLEVDNRVVVPVDTHIRFIITGQDVIHDFAVPSLGVKVDAVPGKISASLFSMLERQNIGAVYLKYLMHILSTSSMIAQRLHELVIHTKIQST